MTHLWHEKAKTGGEKKITPDKWTPPFLMWWSYSKLTLNSTLRPYVPPTCFLYKIIIKNSQSHLFSLLQYITIIEANQQVLSFLFSFLHQSSTTDPSNKSLLVSVLVSHFLSLFLPFSHTLSLFFLFCSELCFSSLLLIYAFFKIKAHITHNKVRSMLKKKLNFTHNNVSFIIL